MVQTRSSPVVIVRRSVLRSGPVPRPPVARAASMFAAILAAIWVFLTPGCSNREGGAAGGGAGGRPPGGARETLVAIETVTPRDLSRSVTVAGPVEAIRVVPVSAQRAGTLARVLAEEGDRVRDGQLLAETDAREDAAQLSRARAVLQNAEAAYRRAEELQSRELASGAEIDALRSSYEIAKADVELWTARVAFSRITAPASGIVVSKRVERGGTVAANQVLFEIAEDATLVARVQVSELDVVHLTPGTTAFVRLDAYPGSSIPGRIRRIFPSADAASRLVPVEVELGRAPDGIAIRPGFLARVEFPLERRAGALAVPAAAVGTAESGDFVYLVQADTLARRRIETGLTTEGWIEVTRGLVAGDRVVTSGHVNLRPGAKARVQENAGADRGPGTRTATGATDGSPAPERPAAGGAR